MEYGACFEEEFDKNALKLDSSDVFITVNIVKPPRCTFKRVNFILCA